MKKFLDSNGVIYLWTKITALINELRTSIGGKVDKVEGKGLSSNDYTFEEKEKLYNIEDGANKTIVENTLSSDSTTNALSAAQGKALDDKITAINTSIEGAGVGDMLSSKYDPDGDGKVGNAENADKADDADKFGGQTPDYYAKTSDIPDVSGFAKTSEVNDALSGKVNTSTLGQANGVATLDSNGIINSSQLPSYVDDVIEGYFNTADNLFYKEAGFTTAITGESSKIYVDVATNLSYRYSGSVFVLITSSDMVALSNEDIDALLATITS